LREIDILTFVVALKEWCLNFTGGDEVIVEDDY